MGLAQQQFLHRKLGSADNALVSIASPRYFGVVLEKTKKRIYKSSWDLNKRNDFGETALAFTKKRKNERMKKC